MLTDEAVNAFYIKLKNTIQNSGATFYRYFDTEFSYSQLYEQMQQFNRILSRYRQERVVLYGSKKFTTYAGIYSIILSNNVWIPLSPENPEERNMVMIKESRPKLILYEDGSLTENILKYAQDHAVEKISYEEILSDGKSKPFEERIFQKDELAYIMFTSGSTGIPKGVPMTHVNYINFVNNILDILPFGKNEVFSDFHDFAFDISIFYLFACPLIQGTMSPIKEAKDKIIPLNHIEKNHVTVWSSVPSVINRIKTFRPKDNISTPIRIMFLCGEPFKLDVLEYCLTNMGLKQVYNFYGLTETGVENFYHRCQEEDLNRYINYGMVPIGNPLPGNQIRITDEKELYIGGCQITPGYLGGRSPDKFEQVDGTRWCKTGDIAEKFEDVYFCKGRLDSQVKLSGYRVELLDIEAHIAKQEEVDQVVCFVDETASQPVLVAAIKESSPVDFGQIQEKLKTELPNYMIPKDYMVLDSFPLNVNGKVDRKKICKLYRK